MHPIRLRNKLAEYAVKTLHPKNGTANQVVGRDNQGAEDIMKCYLKQKTRTLAGQCIK